MHLQSWHVEYQGVQKFVQLGPRQKVLSDMACMQPLGIGTSRGQRQDMAEQGVPHKRLVLNSCHEDQVARRHRHGYEPCAAHAGQGRRQICSQAWGIRVRSV